MKNPFLLLSSVGPSTVYISIERIIHIEDKHNTNSGYECQIHLEGNMVISCLDTFAAIKVKIENYYL